MMNKPIPKEGQHYKTITIGDKEFTLLYGYYSEEDRAVGEPIPILPDFVREPQFDEKGYALATYIQDACPHYRSRLGDNGEGWCADCVHYPESGLEIGVCQCINNSKMNKEA